MKCSYCDGIKVEKTVKYCFGCDHIEFDSSDWVRTGGYSAKDAYTGKYEATIIRLRAELDELRLALQVAQTRNNLNGGWIPGCQFDKKIDELIGERFPVGDSDVTPNVMRNGE